MKKTSLVFFLLSLFSVAFSQAPKEKTLLWEISGKGISQPSYLYGTFHLMCAKDLQVNNIIKEKFNNSKQLYLEMDMDDPAIMMQMMTGMMMKNDTSLTDLINKNEYDSIAGIFQQLSGIPLSLLNKAKPLMAMAAIFPSLLKCTDAEGWEKIFTEMAKEQQKEIKGLETAQQQMDVMDSIPYKTQAQMLSKTLLNVDSTRKSLQELISLYKEKNIQELYKLMEADTDFSQYDSIMIVKRNHNWIPQITDQAKNKPTFFAFGAGHLAGKNGVIDLLRKAGYSVKPVMY